MPMQEWLLEAPKEEGSQLGEGRTVLLDGLDGRPEAHVSSGREGIRGAHFHAALRSGC